MNYSYNNDLLQQSLTEELFYVSCFWVFFAVATEHVGTLKVPDIFLMFNIHTVSSGTKMITELIKDSDNHVVADKGDKETEKKYKNS